MRPLVVALSVLAACDSAPPTEEPPPYEAVCTEPKEVPCQAEMAQELSIQDAVSPGSVISNIEDNDWVVDLDATAGGFIDAADNPWVYVRFTDAGLEKLDITDTEALASMDWHMAWHRFRVRLNGGSSGPSCVSAAPVDGKVYADVVPEDATGLTFEEDAFLDATCTFVTDAPDDPQAPEGIPLTALNGYWDYPDCVSPNGTVFLVRIESGRLLKLEVLQYYGLGQEECDANGTIGGEAARIQLKWAFIQ